MFQMVRPSVPPKIPGEILRSVSRSFYLTLAVLPANVREQVGLAYLLARAADTLADTDLIPRDVRLKHLGLFREWVLNPQSKDTTLNDIKEVLAPLQEHHAERVLLERLEDCRGVLESLSSDDQRLIRAVVGTLIQGMQNDLSAFPGRAAEELTALKTFTELDQYTYDVAGCVGDYWTRMMCAHRPAFHGWEVEPMVAMGIRFGKALQLTNILRDMPADLRRGRCYIPQEMLNEVALRPVDLLKPDALPQLRPVLTRLLRVALEHLDQGWLYTMAIPRRELRVRLACIWPILFAVQTLRRVSLSPALLDPTVTVKMTRGEVYRDMALASGTLGCGTLLTGYYGHLRKSVAC